MTVLKDSHHLGAVIVTVLHFSKTTSIVDHVLMTILFLKRSLYSRFTGGLTMVENCGVVFLCFCGGALVVVLCVCGGVVVSFCGVLWCRAVFVVVVWVLWSFLWWCCGDVFVVVCGGVVVVVFFGVLLW